MVRLPAAALRNPVKAPPKRKKRKRVRGTLSTPLMPASRLSTSSDQERFPNHEHPYFSSDQSRMEPSVTMPMNRPMEHTSRCSTTSKLINEEAQNELMKCDNNLRGIRQETEMIVASASEQMPSLLGRLSDPDPLTQTTRLTSTRKGLALTSRRCHGTRVEPRKTNQPRVFHHPFRKPTLYSRISLGTSSEPGRHCSTVTGPYRNSLSQNGSTYSVGTPSTLTMCSQTSTRLPVTSESQSSSASNLNCSIAPRNQQNQSRPTETGSSPGTLWSMPHCSFSNIEDSNSSCTANTSKGTLLPYPSSFTPASSTMIELSESGRHSVATSSSLISQNLQTCSCNGCTTRPVSHPVHHQSHERDNRRIAVAVPHAGGGTNTGALTQQHPVTTSMCALSAQAGVMSQMTATSPVKSSEESPLTIKWERRPRFVREYVWSDHISSRLSTALVTEIAPPVPGPPENELSNELALSTIRSHPHLFRITTPIKTDRFRALLIRHPNRALVDSVCAGLESGFWPWAVTDHSDAPEIVDNARLQKIRDPSHLTFMRHQRDEEIALGRFSPPFQNLLPGMTTIPLWVVPKPHSDNLRLVVDHSAGSYSPNSFISSDDASTHLDTLHALGAALIRVRKEHGNVPLVLFKTDVSQAYRRLPMHPLWQIRQVVTIDGVHHVDHNNNFGNRGAGRLWITFFGLALWIAIFIILIHDLFAYVDDGFSYEFADQTTFYAPYGKFLPSKQSRLLTLFDDIGIPHEERKQVSGSPLMIIGFNVDPNAMTITMATDARRDIIKAVRDFANPRQRRSLKDFQRLAGWVNWALNVFPLLRPGLSSVYEKMRRGSSPFSKLSVNNSICNELRWLADHMDRSDGVHILESREWTKADADQTYLCDACPTGMGYWSLKTCEGFQCAVSPSSRNGIFFFEALTVLSALSHVCESVFPKPKRLAILTDSSNTFDMFNTLHALPAYNPILITAVDLLIKSNIQLRVFHIPRNDNKVADALSRLDEKTAQFLQPRMIVSNFLPPRFTLGDVPL
ncbi:hypothetical protein BYT27DRAFT_6759205 [Phlegmacium glaucopus]|nr:hypothetical protein BYT27DRAFT_6759205 [Phlegmacium glaucopus]